MKKPYLFLLVIIYFVLQSLILSAQAGNDGWLMSGHDPQRTGASSVNGPTSPDIKWTYQAEDFISDVVVARDNTIYFVVWKGYYSTQVGALNANGTLKWQKSSVSSEYRYPTIDANGTLYVVSVTQTGDDFLLALSPTDGSILWSFNIGDSVIIGTNYSRPLIDPNGTIYTASASGKQGYGTIFAINPDGTEKWTWDTSADTIYCDGNAGLIYCAIESTLALAPNGNLLFKPYGEGAIALNSSTGEFLWRSDFGPNAGGADPFGQTLAIGADNVAYTLEGSGRFNFLAINPDGTIKWQTVMENWGALQSLALSADGSTVYQGDNGGFFYAFDTIDGSLLWKWDIGIEGATISGVPALSANGLIYLAPGGLTSSTPESAKDFFSVSALNAADGTLVWQYPLGWQGSSDPVLGPDGTLYISGKPPSAPSNANPDTLYAFKCSGSQCKPEIAVEGSEAANIADGSTYTMGATLVNVPLTQTFTVRNTGIADLNLITPPTVTGKFTATNFPTMTIPPGGSTTFDLTCTALEIGTPVTGTVSFENNDTDENPFDFTVNCTVMDQLVTPTLVGPANNSLVNQPRPNFTWQSVVGAIRYQMRLSIVNPPARMVFNANATSYQPSSPLLTTQYFWQVRAVGPNNTFSEWSSVWSVTIVSPVGAAPQINLTTNSTVPLSWSVISWATKYQVQVDNQPDFSSPEYDNAGLTASPQPSVMTSSLPTGLYYWRVRAQKSNGSWGNWSNASIFVINSFGQ